MEQLPLELLSHPLLQLTFALVPAALIGWIVAWQADQLGLSELTLPVVSKFRWPTFFGAVAFWVGLLGTLLMTLTSAPGFLWEVLDLLMRLLAGGVMLMLGNLASRALEERASRARDGSRERLAAAAPAALIVGLLAAALVLAQATGLFFWVAVIALIGWGLSDAGRREKTRAFIKNVSAVFHIEGQVPKGTRLIDGREVVSSIGLTATWVADEERRVLVPNSELLTLLPSDALPDKSSETKAG